MSLHALLESDTSHKAYESIAPHKNRIAEHIYRCIAATGKYGITCDTIEQFTGISHQTASARVRELVQAGLVIDSGKRGKTRSGSQARLYVVCK